MKKEISFLGLAFESAFKLGFLKDLISNYEDFKNKQIFENLKGEIESFEGGIRYLPALDILERNIPFDIFEKVPQELTNLGIKDTPENSLLFLFILGYYQGYFYRRKFENINLIKYHMGEESQQAGIYKNADLLFTATEEGKKSLYVVDFKLAGARKKISEIFSIKEGNIPYRVFGLPVNLSLGELSFEKAIQNILKVEEKLLSLQETSAELKGFLQILSYAVDYLSQHNDYELEEVCLSLLYPFSESFVARFWLKNKDISIYKDKIRKLYGIIKQKDWKYEEIDKTRPIRIKRLREESQNQIENLIKNINDIQNKIDVINPDSIQQSRKDIGKRLNYFSTIDDNVKVLCLLHSAGSGKTSQTRELILNSEGKHIVFYFATRKVLVDREYEVIKQKANNYSIALVYEKRAGKKSMAQLSGDTFKSIDIKSGIIKRTVEEVAKYTSEKCNKKFIWAFATQQAIVGTKYKEKGSTVEYILDKLTSKRILDNYTFNFIFDEFLGYQNGLFIIEEIIKVLKEIKRKGGKANLYLFDANGYTPAVIEKLLKEYREFEVFPSALVLSDFKQEDFFKIDGIPFYSFAKHGYPSPKINLKRKFVFLEKPIFYSDDEFIEKIANIINETYTDKESTAFVFIQNKEHLSDLKSKLENKGYTTLVATADSKKSQKRINEGDEDIIFATSAISRGIDLSRPNKPVNHIYAVIYDWGIETNLVELIQAISRARGDEKTESIPKNLTLIYIIDPVNESVLQKIEEYLDEEKVDTETIKLLYQKHALEQKLILDTIITKIIKQFLKSKESQALVPIPNQYKTKYIPNNISDLETLLNFLDGLRQIENKNQDLYLLQKTLIKALSASIVNFDLKSYKDYFHPYILSEEYLRYSFNNKQRSYAKNLLDKLKPILEEHNEEKFKELEEIIKSFLPRSQEKIPVLLPTYGVVLVKHFLKPEEKIEFKIKGRIGRGGAEVLMGSIEPTTKCYVSKTGENEYACITLTEDYPYKEILSGRFVKFPVEFIKGLLEV